MIHISWFSETHCSMPSTSIHKLGLFQHLVKNALRLSQEYFKSISNINKKKPLIFLKGKGEVKFRKWWVLGDVNKEDAAHVYQILKKKRQNHLSTFCFPNNFPKCIYFRSFRHCIFSEDRKLFSLRNPIKRCRSHPVNFSRGLKHLYYFQNRLIKKWAFVPLAQGQP